MNDQNEVPSMKDPIWIDKVWLDTVVVLGLTCFILCLKGLGKVSTKWFPVLLVAVRSDSHGRIILSERFLLQKWVCSTVSLVWLL
jgi:hypothetical protein